jgi:hypothetical protein
MALPISKARFLKIATEEAAELGEKLGLLASVLEFVYEYPVVVMERSHVKLSGAQDESNVRKYVKQMLHSHFARRKVRVVLGEVGTVADPAVDSVLEAFGKVARKDLPAFSEHHRKSMAAENKIGDLLEAYLAEVLEPRGWVWCCGNLITGVDFFKPSSRGCESTLLQVKNRSNSENSSSSRIRELVKMLGCPVEIRKWYRCRSTDGSTCWERLVGNEDCSLADEKRFHEFVRKYPSRH